jgi:hypothetical protein
VVPAKLFPVGIPSPSESGLGFRFFEAEEVNASKVVASDDQLGNIRRMRSTTPRHRK